jgi:hypothetical protein
LTAPLKNSLSAETLLTAEALQWIAERPPLIEVCPTSNSFTLNLTDLKDHPTLGTWIKTGYPIAISTGSLSFIFILCHSMLCYAIIWHSMMWCDALYNIILCLTRQHHDTLYYTILCYILFVGSRSYIGRLSSSLIDCILLHYLILISVLRSIVLFLLLSLYITTYYFCILTHF